MGYGSAIGGLVGGTAGTYFGGPAGAMIGGTAGAKVGDWLGSKFGGAPAEDPFAASLRAAAAGKGAPSAAEGQLRRGMDQGIAQQYALGASAHGMSPAAALHASQVGAAGVASDVNSQAAILRAQEQERARAAYAAYLQNQTVNAQNQQGLNLNDQQNTQRLLFGNMQGGLVGGLGAAGAQGLASEWGSQAPAPGPQSVQIPPGASSPSSGVPIGQDSQFNPSDPRFQAALRAYYAGGGR